MRTQGWNCGAKTRGGFGRAMTAACPSQQAEQGQKIKEHITTNMLDKSRNTFIFPDGLTEASKRKDSTIKDPLHYSPVDLCDAFLRNPKTRKHIDKIVVESAFYCKQIGDLRHEFILLQVTDSDNRKTNSLILDRTDPENNLEKIQLTRLNSGQPKSSAVGGRLLVSYYGDKQSLLARCGLADHIIVEELEFPKTRALLLYEVLFMASSISSKCHTSLASLGEGYRFAHALWACMLSMAPKAILKPRNQGWRKEIFHRFNLFELADIIFDTRHHIMLSYSVLKLNKIAIKPSDCTRNDLSLSALDFLHCLEQGDSPVSYMQIDRVSTHVISALYCKDSGPYEHEFIRLIVANEANPSVTGLLPALDQFTISSRAGEPPVLRGKPAAFQVVERLEFKFGACSLYRLVVLAAAVASTRPNYQLLRAQCYWFASTIWECVQGLDPTAIHAIVVPSIRGRRVFFHQRATSSDYSVGRFHLESLQTPTSRENHSVEGLYGDALVRKVLLRLKLRQRFLCIYEENLRETPSAGQALYWSSRFSRVDSGNIRPEGHNKLRDIETPLGGFGGFVRGKQAMDQPLLYNFPQLNSMFEQLARNADPIRNLYVSSAVHCRMLQPGNDNFLVLQVRNRRTLHVADFVVLDRTGIRSMSRGFIASNSVAQDRSHVFSDENIEEFLRLCGLHPYEVLECLALPSSPTSTPLSICELVILARRISDYQIAYAVEGRGSFSFEKTAWECMRKLRPKSCYTNVTQNNTRWRFSNIFRQDVYDHVVGTILHAARVEIMQFRIQLAQSKENAYQTPALRVFELTEKRGGGQKTTRVVRASALPNPTMQVAMRRRGDGCTDLSSEPSSLRRLFGYIQDLPLVEGS
ncbi:hypothetical protein BDV93DRAFT_581116 [Ceratobasidium sp. AG-I]|nr:hypothetical protein BDV93DRAFT_581116 [Ceratobasidium sp. AG-I]